MLKIINQLRNKYIIADIENALVQFFIENNNIPLSENHLILSILKINKSEVREIKNYLFKELPYLDIHNLISMFEMLIPEEDRKVNGAFYTPKKITKLMVDDIINADHLKICDLSCGCGAFLIEAAEKLTDDFDKDIIEVIEENIFGADIADYSVRRCKILFSLIALIKGRDVKDIKFNIYAMDSLEANWKAIFPDVFVNGGFDVVIGNPPYVRFQDLPDNLRKSLYYNWTTLKKGSYNLYFAFFEIGVKLLNNTGILGYITPNNYFTSLSGIHLREFLTKNTLIYKIIDFNHLLLFAVQTYTCITFLKKEENNTFLYERVDNYDDYEKLDRLDQLTYSKVNYSTLNNKKWRLLRYVDRDNIIKIENFIKLGQLTDIRVGIATLKDSVYFVDGSKRANGCFLKEFNDKEYLIETEITKPIDKISDFINQEDLNNNERRIIFPYKNKSHKPVLIAEDELKNQYPKTYEYLLAAKKELKTREKGKGEYVSWYAYGRTQGLNFNGPKLLTPTFSATPRFLYEKDPDSLFCNGYAIYLKNKRGLLDQELTLDILSKILNSKVMEYYISKTSVSIEGGYPCYQKNFIELFGIPEFSKEDLEFLREVDDKEKIDKYLIKKYGLNI
jgi:type I restriction-modification system DNA methylase subunit